MSTPGPSPDPALRKYLRRADRLVTAIPLALDTDGLVYRKWGGVQRASAGDWLVENGGDVYTVDREVFERTYRRAREGRYEKVQPVWARTAERDGVIPTKEGETHYEKGDVLVFNQPDGTDGYAMSRTAFERLYEPAEPGDDDESP